MRRSKNLLLILSFFLSLSACSHKKNKWGYREHLPSSASEIKEWYIRDELLPDYEYYLKARISPSEFEKYRIRLGLSFHTDSSKYGDDMDWLSTAGVYSDSVSKWWNFTSNSDSLFVWQKGDEWNIARYIDGHVYLYAHNH
jgi:hypothetical protein